jgi:hypothetical protein
MGSYGPPPGPPGPPGWGPPLPGGPRKPNNGGVVVILVLAAFVLLAGGGPACGSGTPMAGLPQPGNCVRNTGGYTHPRLYVSGCAPGHYRILGRIDGTTDTKRCASTGYTYAVWCDSPSYVLCMRRL